MSTRTSMKTATPIIRGRPSSLEPWSGLGDSHTVPGLTLTESGQRTSYLYRYWVQSGKSY